MKKVVKNISASVRARLLNRARTTGRNFQELTVRYVVERFLARLTESEYRERFVLKGAMLCIPWKLDDKRSTMDLDLLAFGNPDPENLLQIFQRICEVEIADDGLVFNKEGITVTPIREESVYSGIRMNLQVTLDAISIPLQVDVGFGDSIVPEAQQAEFPALLAEHGPVIHLYPPETVIAEKFNAMVLLGMANSRMKDYFDIWLLSRSFTIEGTVLWEAIRQTFARRQTALPETEPIGLRDEFATNKSKQNQWKGFVRRQQKQDVISDLSETVVTLRDFLMPVVIKITATEPPLITWFPDRGWQRTE